MVDSILNTAQTGLQAAKKDLQAAASNTANAQTRSAPADEPLPKGGYEPVRTNRQALPTGGVQSDFQPIDPRSVPVAAQGDSRAGEDGVVQQANVSLQQEALRTLQAENQYRANAQVVQTADELSQTLLNQLS